MTKAEAERAVQAAEALHVAVNAEWKAFQALWKPEWQQNPEAERFRAPRPSGPKRPAMTQGHAAFQVEEARRQLAAIEAGSAIEAAQRAATKVEAAKAKVEAIAAGAEKKLAPVREEFVAALQEFQALWRQVPELARDVLPVPFCLAAPYVDGRIVKTIKAVGT